MSEPTIGIIGAGTAGLHLALRLGVAGVPFTLYAERTPEQARAGRLQATVVHFAPTLERERELDVDHWAEPAIDELGVNLHDGAGNYEGFRGAIPGGGLSVDYRVYQSRLLEDVIERGGEVEFGPVQPHELPAIADRHDLTVVATGRASLTQVFPRIDEHSPFKRPQRLLAAFLAEGLPLETPAVFDQNVTPHGEIIEVPMWTADGRATGILFEARPGSPFESLLSIDVDSGTEAFERAFVGLVGRHVRRLSERLDSAAFRVRSPRDLVRGALTPTVRRAYTVLPSGRLLVAAGDVQAVNDPVTGQGANTASYSAFLLADLITSSLGFDVAFGEKVDQRLWSYAQSVVRSTNTLISTPTPEWVGSILAAALEDQGVADGWTSTVNDAELAWEALGSPERARRFIHRYRTTAVAG